MKTCYDIVEVCRVYSSIDTANADNMMQYSLHSLPKLEFWPEVRIVLIENAAYLSIDSRPLKVTI